MATTALDIGPFILAAAETVLVTVPAGKDYNIASVRFLNTDVSMRTITIYEYKPPGTAATNTSPVALNFTLNPGEIYEYGPTILAATRVMSALCDVANKVTVHVSGWSHQ
jgi:hypothetical protein